MHWRVFPAISTLQLSFNNITHPCWYQRKVVSCGGGKALLYLVDRLLHLTAVRTTVMLLTSGSVWDRTLVPPAVHFHALCTWWSFQKIMPALVAPLFRPHNGFMLHLKLRRSVWPAEPYRICPHSCTLPLCSQLPLFTHFYLNCAHHFFNSTDSPGFFTSQGLCTYSFYFQELCPLYS